MNKTTLTYQFKPMKRLTFWARLLMCALVAGLFLWALGMVVSMLGGSEGRLVSIALLATGVVLATPLYFISGIVTLCWVYGACRNAHVLRPAGIHSSPAWAVGWWFIPFASLYKPYEAIRDIWVASHGRVNDRYLPGSPVIILWWWLFLIGNITLRLSGDETSGDSLSYASTPGNWAFVAGACISAAATMLFFRLVGEIHKNQLASNTQSADVF